MFNPVQTKQDMAARLEVLAQLFETATVKTTLIMEIPANQATQIPDDLRAIANALKVDPQ